jgi:preprotein translocase subunit YajC
MSFLKRIIMLLAIMAALVVGFYWAMHRQVVKREAGPEVDQSLIKQGDQTYEVTGLVTTVDGRYFIKREEGALIEIDSLQLNLQVFIGEEVKVAGQYSGDTLMVSKIEVIE